MFFAFSKYRSRSFVFSDNNEIAANVMTMKDEIARIMSAKRARVADSMDEPEETLETLRDHGTLKIRTVGEMKLALIMTTVYEKCTQNR